MNCQSIIEKHWNPSIQMSAGQIIAIGSAIRAAAPDANVLVFGCGNDSELWHEMNHDGYTLFLEDDAGWIEKVRGQQPELNIAQIAYGDRTVENSLPIDEEALQTYPVPVEMLSRQWDVIVIDAPRGHKPWLPGRSLPIFWSAQVARPVTQVFIDDYSRRLEKAYADRFFRSVRPWSTEIRRLVQRGTKSTSSLLWVLGVSDEAQEAALLAQEPEEKEAATS